MSRSGYGNPTFIFCLPSPLCSLLSMRKIAEARGSPRKPAEACGSLRKPAVSMLYSAAGHITSVECTFFFYTAWAEECPHAVRGGCATTDAQHRIGREAPRGANASALQRSADPRPDSFRFDVIERTWIGMHKLLSWWIQEGITVQLVQSKPLQAGDRIPEFTLKLHMLASAAG